MKIQFFCYVFAFFMNSTPLEKKQNETGYNFDNKQNLKWRELDAFVGSYSKDTGFIDNELVENQLKKILGDDYNSYMRFVKSAGSGIVEKLDDIIYCDISLEHISGYNSLILINMKEREMYLFWMNGTVRDKNFKIYGKRPIPLQIKKIIEDDMNTGWGHVARFEFKNDSLLINLKLNSIEDDKFGK